MEGLAGVLVDRVDPGEHVDLVPPDVGGAVGLGQRDRPQLVTVRTRHNGLTECLHGDAPYPPVPAASQAAPDAIRLGGDPDPPVE